MKCPNCGAEVKEQDKICGFCNTPLDREARAETEKAVEGSADAGKEAGEAVQAEAEEAASPKKGRKTAVMAIAAAAIVGISAFGFTKLWMEDPKEVVIDAFKSVYSEKQTYPLEEIFGLSQFGENAGKSMESSVTLILDDCSETTADSFAGSGFRVETKDDRENLKSAVDISAIYNNMDILTINMYYGDEKLMAAVPELLDTVFVADLSDGLGERMAASPVFGPVLEAQGVDIEGIAAYFEATVDQARENGRSGSYDLKGLLNRYKEGCTAQGNFKAAMTVEKTGKAKFQMDGKMVSCKGYQVHISKASMIEFLRTSSDFFLQDEELKQEYLENLETSTKLMELLGTGYKGLSAKEMQEQAYEETSKQVQAAIEEFDKVMGDVDMTVYVDPKGRLAAVKGSTAVGEEGTELQEVTFEAYLEGGAYLTQNARVNLSVDSDNGPVVAALTKTGSWDGKQLISGFEASSQGVELILDGQYAVEDGAYELKAEVKRNSLTQARLSASGVIDEVEKGTSIHCSMDEISLELIPAMFDLTISGDYYLRPFSGEIAEPEGKMFDVFTANVNDWQGVALQAYFGTMKLMQQLDIDL